MDAVILLSLFFLFMFLSVPIGVSIGLAIIITLTINPIVPMAFLGQAMINNLSSFPLLAVPFFMLAGFVMESGGLSRRLVAFAKAFVGNRTGGLATVTVLTCLLFGAISGSAPATVAAVGTIMIPSMVKENYSREYAAGLTAVSGGLGVILPPSIPFVLFGLATNASISRLFLAGVLPGLLVAALLAITSRIISGKRGYHGTGEEFSWRRLCAAFWDAKWALFAPVIILGGIYGGIFTPTEAAVMGVVYGLVVGKFLYKELTLEKLIHAFVENGKLVGAVIITFATAIALGTILALLQIPQQISAAIASISTEVLVVMLILNIFLLIMGLFMDTAAAILILAPLFASILIPLGVDLTHLGVIMTVNLAIGFVTPPVAVSIFIASGVSGASLLKVGKEAMPFVLALLVALVIIVLVPELSLWLPNLVMD